VFAGPAGTSPFFVLFANDVFTFIIEHSSVTDDVMSRVLLKRFGAKVARGVVVNALVTISEVDVRRSRLLLGWVTVCRQVNHLGM